MSRDLVSVVMATNRASAFLAEALASVKAQTHPHVEVIVVDDGSPDPAGLERVVADVLPDARLIHLPASGVSAARNRGAAVAAGPFLAFLDDDDRWHPDRLAAQVARLADRTDAIACYCGMRTIDPQGRVLAEADQVAVDGRQDIAARRTGIILPNLVIRTEAFRAADGFDRTISLAEDLDLLLRLAEVGEIAFEPRALVDYRAHGANTTRRHHELTLSIDRVLRRHRALAAETGDVSMVAAFDESLRKNDRFAWWGAGRTARGLLRSGRPFAAFAELAWAWRAAPKGLADGLRRRMRGGTGRDSRSLQ